MSWKGDVRHGLDNLNQDKKSLRKFGLVMTTALLVLGVLIFFRSSHPQRAYVLWAVASICLVVGVGLPAALRRFHTIWMAFSLSIGWIMSRLILTILFFLVITPTGLIMRAFGKDPMMRKLEPNATTYWIKREKGFNPEQYERQF